MRACRDGFRTIWHDRDGGIRLIDQRRLPHDYELVELETWRDGYDAIADMLVRGAPLIGATAAWSLYLAARAGGRTEFERAATQLERTRPTPGNHRGAIDRVKR
ncbi:MAG: S-methyl-5-thioribose-1-phosphate isomerase, partial [Pseudomonadota bacterium]